MADGLFYLDAREPFLIADLPQITLSTTDKALYAQQHFPVLGGQYFARGGRRLKISLFGKMTTGTTPGNGTWGIYYGTGADANGVLMASSAALTLIASQTNISWELEIFIHCRTMGNAGTLFCRGRGFIGTALVAVGDFLIPASAAVASAAVDLTAALIPSVQFKRTGSTGELITVQDMEVIAY